MSRPETGVEDVYRLLRLRRHHGGRLCVLLGRGVRVMTVSFSSNYERGRRLWEIKEEISGLLEEAEGLLKGTPEAERARAYWLAHIKIALDRSHGYLASSMCTMEDSVAALTDEDDE